MDELLKLLTDLGIPFIRYDHPAVFTCEESDKLCPPMPGAHTKQLLMKGKRGDTYVLAIVMHDKRVDTNALAKEYDVKSFSFVSAERLKEMLGVEPGSVTPLGLVFDTEKKIKVMIDEDAWNMGQFRFHPLVNTATLVIDQDALKKFLTHTGHDFTIRSIPQRVNG